MSQRCPNDATDPPNARKFLEETTMTSILGIPEEALDAVMAIAYQLYQAGRYPEVEVLCRGLVAADHRYWWSYSLYAATLRSLGRLREAVARWRRASSTSRTRRSCCRCAASCARRSPP